MGLFTGDCYRGQWTNKLTRYSAIDDQIFRLREIKGHRTSHTYRLFTNIYDLQLNCNVTLINCPRHRSRDQCRQMKACAIRPPITHVDKDLNCPLELRTSMVIAGDKDKNTTENIVGQETTLDRSWMEWRFMDSMQIGVWWVWRFMDSKKRLEIVLSYSMFEGTNGYVQCSLHKRHNYFQEKLKCMWLWDVSDTSVSVMTVQWLCLEH